MHPSPKPSGLELAKRTRGRLLIAEAKQGVLSLVTKQILHLRIKTKNLFDTEITTG